MNGPGIGLRDHLSRLRDRSDIVSIDDRVHWDEEAAAVASVAAREGGPAVIFEETPGRVRFVAGAFGGPDQLAAHDREPWDRIGDALTAGEDVDAVPSTHAYHDLLDLLAGRGTEPVPRSDAEPAATPDPTLDLHTLGLPTLSANARPLVSLGVLAVDLGPDAGTTWVPVRGDVRGSSRLRIILPRAFHDRLERAQGTPADGTADAAATGVSVLLGVSAPVLLAALQGWIGDRVRTDTPELAAGLAPVAVSRVADRIVPRDAEVRIDGVLEPTADPEPAHRGDRRSATTTAVDAATAADEWRAAWEATCATATAVVRADRIATREDPIVAFAPLGAPLSDDTQIVSLLEAARLSRRVNGYWGVSPVRWVRLPPEGGLGICLVASEILYAGFEWQLANTLFSFSNLFDKVLIVDENSDPTDLAKALDDMWVKAHPANDWAFSEPHAPSATATRYRRDGETGSRLHIAATWDPRWDEEYIAPRVTFEQSFPENVRESVRERWDEFGLDRE
ncbi:UbiD family decarboxylase domain-containing protein [Halopenitus sp. POP-27]|uniref:UbiD family decarboxylase domain-containing protein n=1 Tax=Halopenitus sp. POP-27 TaxID=2994425 RepID=UPI002468716E|nr:UbiD family decarboxylase domain-containing protein [Halopenitus sp. POP-27]